MAYHIQLINDHKIVRICHEGVVDVSEMNTCKNTAIIHLKRLGWKRVLIDLRDAEFQIRSLDVAFLYKNLDNVFPIGASIAVLPPQEMDFDYGEYSKSVAAEWSNSNVELFDQEDLAIDWLIEQ